MESEVTFSLGQMGAGFSLLLMILAALFASMRFSATHSSKEQQQNDRIAHLEGRLEEMKDGFDARLKEQKDCLAETGAILLRNDKEIEVLRKLFKLHDPERG